MSDKITPPWEPWKVDALNRFQRAETIHPFTCVEAHEGADRRLVATSKGWICPHCDYTQKWAHDFMLNEPPPNPFIKGAITDAYEAGYRPTRTGK